MLTFGLLLNPVAGLGGATALKGSDGEANQAIALARGGSPRAPQRLQQLLAAGPQLASGARWLTVGGDMGAEALTAAGVACRSVYEPSAPSSAADTRNGAKALAAAGADVLVFLGGDGTARDVLDGIGDSVPVIGVPSGVKMHSGVFATSPRAAAEVLARLIDGGMVASRRAEVRDVDETALRAGRTGSRYYGELRVPELGGYLQATKIGGKEDERLALEDIVAHMSAFLPLDERTIAFGPGGTMLSVKAALGAENGTLLGFDVRQADGAWAMDVDARGLEALSDPLVVLSFSRGQGILIGRGNQQLSPLLLGRLRPENFVVTATRTKLDSLSGRPLLIDSASAEVDARLSGLWELVVGFEDYLLYQVQHA